jgi:hypothetical protein
VLNTGIREKRLSVAEWLLQIYGLSVLFNFIGATMRILLISLFFISSLLADGTLNLFIFNDGEPYIGLDVKIDDKKSYKTDEKGSLQFITLTGGRHIATVYDKSGVVISAVKFKIAHAENTQIILRLKGERLEKVDMEEPKATEEDALLVRVKELEKREKGFIAGIVKSSEDGTPIKNVKIFVKGYPVDGSTDGKGKYSLELPEGNYSISMIHTDFSSQTINNIPVKGHETSVRDIELTPASLELAEFVVLAPHIEGSIASVIEEKRNTTAVADVLGSEQFSKTGDSDAAGALKRASGITVVGGKYVFVRGLGERYSNTLLNNLGLSSPEPTRRVVPLDLFPTGVIESMMIQKTFSPDIPATFGGGTIQIRTKNIPDNFFLKVSASTTYIEGTTFQSGSTYSGGSYDYLGYDDGGRELDTSLTSATDGGTRLKDEIKVGNTVIVEGITKDDRTAFGKEILRDAQTEDQTLYPPVSASVTVGDRFELGESDTTVGYLASLTYGQEFDNITMDNGVYKIGVGNQRFLENGGTYDVTNRDIKLGLLFGLGVNFGDANRFRTTTFYINKTNDITREFDGTDENKNHLKETYLSWVERNLLINQIEGTHKFLDDKLQAVWSYGNSQAERDEPSTVEYAYAEQEDGTFKFMEKSSNYKYTNNYLTDTTDNFKIDLKYYINPFDTEADSEVKIGYEMLKKERESETRRFTFNPSPTERGDIDLTGSINTIINGANIDSGYLTLQDIFLDTDFYTASQDLTAYYLMTNLIFTDNLSLMAGVRMEDSSQKVKIAGKTTEVPSDETLPALTATYKLNEDMQIRVGYGKTLSRPDFREFSEARYQDPETGDSVRGNEELTYTTIENYDVRWEWYISEMETVSVALFTKEFTDPIETVLDSSDKPIVTYINATEASLYGVEFDFRKNLEFIDEALDLYSLSGNIAIIESEVKLGEDLRTVDEEGRIQGLTTNNREMQGQSPYVINIQASYDNPDEGTSLNLAYNRFGKRIRRLGQQGLGDQYEQPFNQVDLIAIQEIDDNWKLKFKIKNILDEEVTWKQDGETTRKYKRGRSYSFGFDWKY